MPKHVVHCRVCKEPFDTEERTDWIMPSKRYYYHKVCYDTWVKGKADLHKNSTDEEWFVYLKDYLANEVRADINYPKLNNQWNSFLKKRYTAKGIYFAMKYFFEAGHGDSLKTDGIGIIPYIYDEACTYWYKRNEREQGICDRIEEQLRMKAEQDIIQTKITAPKKRKSTKYDFSQMEGIE